MIEVGQVRDYFEPMVGGRPSVAMLVLEVTERIVKALPVLQERKRPGRLVVIEYELADFERFYPTLGKVQAVWPYPEVR